MSGFPSGLRVGHVFGPPGRVSDHRRQGPPGDAVCSSAIEAAMRSSDTSAHSTRRPPAVRWGAVFSSAPRERGRYRASTGLVASHEEGGSIRVEWLRFGPGHKIRERGRYRASTGLVASHGGGRLNQGSNAPLRTWAQNTRTRPVPSKYRPRCESRRREAQSAVRDSHGLGAE